MDWRDDALCKGSDRWFPTNQHDRAEVVRLCREECQVYRECLAWALTGVPVYGVVAGLNMVERGVRPKHQLVAPPDEDPVDCLVCGKVYVRWTGGRPRNACSKWCSRVLWKRNQGERISA